MPKHRIILIGHGVISKVYIAAFSNTKNTVIVGVVGRNAKKVRLFAEEHGIARWGISIEEVALQTRATIAIICTPNVAHYEGVMTASRLGLHCLCEKPLHICPDKQLEMINSCKKYGVKLATSYMRRFANHFLYVKELIDSGGLGCIRVVDVIIKHYRPKAYYDSWHGTKEIDGGGPFIQQGSHIIDLAQWLCGGYRYVIEAKLYQVYHDIETEDHGYAMLRYNNGAVGMIEASTACKGLSKESIEISGTKGSLIANYKEIIAFEVEGMQQPIFRKNDDTNETLFRRLAVDFIQSIEDDRFPFIHGDLAKTATELIHAIYEKAGEPIRL